MRELKRGEVELGMKVRIITESWEIEGMVNYLYQEDPEDFGFNIDTDNFVFGNYRWRGCEKVYLVEEVKEIGAIKSDGGSSSYYDIEVPGWLLDKLQCRADKGKCYIKTEEVNEMLGNDFNYSTIFKSMVRAISIENGVGKEGNTHNYECNKMRYYTDRVEESHKNRTKEEKLNEQR